VDSRKPRHIELNDRIPWLCTLVLDEFVLGLQASSFSRRMAFIMVPALPDGAYPTFSLAPESDGKGAYYCGPSGRAGRERDDDFEANDDQNHHTQKY